MTESQAVKIQEQIENLLVRNGVHYKIEYVRTSELKFINFNISIKITE